MWRLTREDDIRIQMRSLLQLGAFSCLLSCVYCYSVAIKPSYALSSSCRATSFTPLTLAARPAARPIRRRKRTAGISMFGDQFSAEGAATLAGSFFSASLFPYLACMFFMRKEEARLHPTVQLGYGLVLVFVALTIPCGIIAKNVYGLSLADTDWLHGGAESLLTITNLVLVKGFQDALKEVRGANANGADNVTKLNTPAVAVLGALALLAIVGMGGGAGAADVMSGSEATFLGFGPHTPFLGGIGDLPASAVTWGHPEPINALSIPCWIIHWSSLIEYLVAQDLAWQLAEETGQERLKGLTWGMVPLHTSGLVACTYHFLYNSPQVGFMLALQAGMTCFGNTTLAFAAWRLASQPAPSGQDEEGGIANAKPQAVVAEPAASTDDAGPDLTLLKVTLISVLASYATKYGEVLLDFPFDPDWRAPALMIGIPATLNVIKWAQRSRQDSTAAESA
ncbi:unnamed protein product [Chrysoparadoxa australica]